MRNGLLAAVTVVALLGAGCTSDDGAADPAAATVVTTTSIWADVVANVACDGLADVKTLIPRGGDPHSFEPSLADRGAMEDAVLVVANGRGLEEGLEDSIAAVEASGTPVYRVAEEAGTGDDPHIWLDPVAVAAALPALAEHLIEAAGLDAAAVGACLTAYQASLEELDVEISRTLTAVPAGDRKLVTNHDALGFFAERYGFEVVGIVIPSTAGLAEANPAELEELAVVIQSEGVPAIFAESQHSTEDAEALAARVGDIEVVTLFTGSLGGPGSGADTYAALLRTNAELIASALS